MLTFTDSDIDMPLYIMVFFLTTPAGLDYLPDIVDMNMDMNMNLVTFQPAGDAVVCISFAIIDDMLALEEDERFVVDFGPEEGEFQVGGNSQTAVIIQDNDGMLRDNIFHTIMIAQYVPIICCDKDLLTQV